MWHCFPQGSDPGVQIGYDFEKKVNEKPLNSFFVTFHDMKTTQIFYNSLVLLKIKQF